jgi:hypothetical protein
MAILQELLKIEQSLWTNNPEVYEARYLPDAVLIFPEVGRIGRDFAVQAIREENRSGKRWAEVALENAALGRLTRDVMLLTYEARARWNDATAAEGTHCATIYVHRHGEWRVAFHQQTPASSQA